MQNWLQTCEDTKTVLALPNKPPSAYI